ncbi:MAG: hypothetical protein IJG33_11715 [Selenomonadaceae bacterium]|nr:hypothetical protein [Selenomonadaceae bacterium]
MPEAQAKENPSRIIPLTADDYIIMQLKDLKDEFRDSRKELNARMDRLEAKQETTRKELNERMDRLENRQDKLEAKLETTRQELNERIDKVDAKIDKLEEKLDAKFDALASKIDSSNKHGNLMTTSVIGIALGVLYVIFFK